jgi:hypothetical protein
LTDEERLVLANQIAAQIPGARLAAHSLVVVSDDVYASVDESRTRIWRLGDVNEARTMYIPNTEIDSIVSALREATR